MPPETGANTSIYVQMSVTLPPRVLTHTKSHQRTPDQRLPTTTMCMRVSSGRWHSPPEPCCRRDSGPQWITTEKQSRSGRSFSEFGNHDCGIVRYGAGGALNDFVE
jgi:hypothetical protein